MFSFLGGLAVKYFGSRAAKAVLGGLVNAGTVAAFTNGFSEQIVPVAHELGVLVGGVAAKGILFALNFAVGYLPVYLKANKPNPKFDKVVVLPKD